MTQATVVKRLRQALAGLVGASHPDELRGIADALQGADIPEDEKGALLNAIEALIDTQGDLS